MDSEYNNLDDDWINNFENTDKLYKDFYKDDLYYVNLRAIYINRDNEIEKLKQESFLMSKPNNITHDEILEILKKNSVDNDNLIFDPDFVSSHIPFHSKNLLFSISIHIYLSPYLFVHSSAIL